MRTGIIAAAVLVLCLAVSAAGAGEQPPVTMTVAAAASLRYSFEDDLIPLFREKHPWITVESTYDSSGKLQTQIENGLAADVFMSAAMRQMNALVNGGYVDPASVTPLLENKIVLIRPAGSTLAMASFTDALAADTIAVGDPDSVPAGHYARDAFTALGIWDKVLLKASLGTNVTEVLHWVAEGSAGAGVVYATDAATTDKVEVVAEAPEGSLANRVIYPAAIVATSGHRREAELFLNFLASDEALAVFAKYGFSPAMREGE